MRLYRAVTSSGLPVPQEPNAMILSARQVLLQWKPETGIVSTGLTLRYKVEETQRIGAIYTTDTCILLSLLPAYMYTFTVRTCYRNQCGSSTSIRVKMPEDGEILHMYKAVSH